MAKLKQTFSNGQTIYHQGDVSDCAFEVLSGVVEMVEDVDSGEVRVGIARTGDMFGETGLIEGGRRENTARPVGDAVVRVIVGKSRSVSNEAEPSSASMVGSLFERYGGRNREIVVEEGKKKSPNRKLSSSGLIQGMLKAVKPLQGRIEVRVAILNNDEDGKQALHIVDAMKRFPDVRAKLIYSSVEIDLTKRLSGELVRVGNTGKQLLRHHDADLLIWGHVPSVGTSIHLHFVARRDWDELLPGAFSLSSDLSLPVNFQAEFGNVLHALVLAAIHPNSGEQAKLRTALMREVVESACSALADIPPGFNTRERASLSLCLGNAYASLWEQTRNGTFLDQAFEVYRGIIALLSGDKSAIDWAIAHKHLSAISVIRAEDGDDMHSYDEAAAAALMALETLPKDDYPVDWAVLQYRLGIIHYKRGFKSGDTDVLRRALRYYRNALLIYSRKDTPNRWGEVMAAFGQAALVFGENEKKLEALETAVNVCNAVLEVCDRKSKPLVWAAAQNNLGSALFLLGKKAGQSKRLRLAVTAFENALAVYQETKLYKHGAITEKNLDRALNLVDWYLPHGRGAIELAGKPVVGLAALKKSVNSGQVVEVVQ